MARERERKTGCKRTRNNPASPGGETKQRERETRKEDYSVHNQDLEIGKSNQRRMSSSGVNVDRLSRSNRLGLRLIECGDNCEMMMTNEPAAETGAGGGPLGGSPGSSSYLVHLTGKRELYVRWMAAMSGRGRSGKGDVL